MEHIGIKKQVKVFLVTDIPQEFGFIQRSSFAAAALFFIIIYKTIDKLININYNSIRNI